MEETKKVIIAGLNVPFWDLVWFMVKLALASIPAIFIIYFFLVIISMLFAAIGQLFGIALTITI